PGLLPEAAHFLGLLLHVPHRRAPRAWRLAQPHAGRGHGPHLDLLRGGARGPFRAGGGVLPYRAAQRPLHGPAAAALVARIPAEREVPLARVAGRALPANRRGRVAVGRDRRVTHLPGT